MRETTWDLDHLALEAPAPRVRVLGALGLAGAAAFAAVIGVRLGFPSALIALPAGLWMARELVRPLRIVVGYRGVRVGRRWIPRDQIVSATTTGGRPRIALSDGRIVRVPLDGPEERQAFVAALARPSTLFEGVHAREALSDVRAGGTSCA